MPRTIRTAFAGGALALVLAVLGAAGAARPVVASVRADAVAGSDAVVGTGTGTGGGGAVDQGGCTPPCQGTGDFIWQIG